MLANLHLHSRFSDGTLWPEEIALEAVRAGLEYVALTDHDTMAGVTRFANACAARGIASVPACELDVFEQEIDYKSELLAYFPHSNALGCAPRTQSLVAESLAKRKRRIEFFLTSARQAFSDKALNFEDLFQDKTGLPYDEGLASQISWSKVDLFLYLKAQRCVPSGINYKSFKKHYLNGGVLKKFRLEKPQVRTVVDTVHADGGYVVIPHIGHLWDDDPERIHKDRDRLRHLLEWFRTRGVDGVELYWYNNEERSSAINGLVQETAHSLGFFFTYGSDCHGPGSGKHTIARFRGAFEGFPAALRSGAIELRDREHR